MNDLGHDLILRFTDHLDILSVARLMATSKNNRDALHNAFPNLMTILRQDAVPKHTASTVESRETFHYARSLRTKHEMEHWAERALVSSNLSLYNAVRRSIIREVQLQRADTEIVPIRMTAEQRRPCRHKPNTNTTIIVQAFAGTGKTSMMIEYAKRNPDTPILYIAYNQALAKESGHRFKPLPHVRVSTMHAFALSHFERDNLVLEELDVEKIQLLFPELTTEVAYETMQAFARYCASCEIERKDERVNTIWNAMFDTKILPVSHDAYLKAYQLLNIRSVDFGVILVDEVQDFTDCMLDILCNFENSTKCFVGDIHQKIYGFKNVQEPYRYLLEHANSTSVKKYSLTKTFRFGHDLAMTVNNFLAYKFRAPGFKSHSLKNTTLKAFSSYDEVPDDGVVIARYNMTIFEVMFHLSSTGRTFHVKGEPVDLRAEMTHLAKIRDFENSERFPSVEDFFEHVYAIRDAKWMLRVSLFSKYGAAVFHHLEVAARFMSDDTGIGIITAHKSKGLEFDKVVLADDFGINSPDECNLMYVAMTRAKESVSLPRVFLNYMFQKHPKLKFTHGTEPSVCSICSRRTRITSMYVEDDPEVILNNVCELYTLQTICDRCQK